MTPRKPDYPRMPKEEIARRDHVVRSGDLLLTRAGYRQGAKKFGPISINEEVPQWLDPITILWLRRGGEIPWEQFKDVIRHGMSGNWNEVEMFLFAWEDND